MISESSSSQTLSVPISEYGRHYYFAAVFLPIEAFSLILPVQVIFENKDGFIALYIECHDQAGYPSYEDMSTELIEDKTYWIQRFSEVEQKPEQNSDIQALLVEKRITRLGLELAFNY